MVNNRPLNRELLTGFFDRGDLISGSLFSEDFLSEFGYEFEDVLVSIKNVFDYDRDVNGDYIYDSNGNMIKTKIYDNSGLDTRLPVGIALCLPTERDLLIQRYPFINDEIMDLDESELSMESGDNFIMTIGIPRDFIQQFYGENSFVNLIVDAVGLAFNILSLFGISLKAFFYPTLFYLDITGRSPDSSRMALYARIPLVYSKFSSDNIEGPTETVTIPVFGGLFTQAIPKEKIMYSWLEIEPTIENGEEFHYFYDINNEGFVIRLEYKISTDNLDKIRKDLSEEYIT